MIIGVWINQKRRLEVSSIPVNFKKTNGIVLLRRILTNGHSYSFVIPPSVYNVLSNHYGVYLIKRMNIIINIRKNLEFAPILDHDSIPPDSDSSNLWLNRE